MSATEQDVRAKVQVFLTKRFRIGLERNDLISIDFESTRGFVSVATRGERVVIRIEAVVAFNVPESPALFEHVARRSGSFLFGHLVLQSDDDTPGSFTVLFSHALLGNFLDEDELINAVVAVVGTANQIDDDLVAQFGGETFHS